MDDLLDSIGDLTDARDRGALERTLVAVICERVGAARLTLWRILRRRDGVKLRRRLRLENASRFAATQRKRRVGEGMAPSLEPLDSCGAGDDPATLESPSDLFSCVAARAQRFWTADADGLSRAAFPICDGEEAVGILEIQRPAPLDAQETRVILALLRIYGNHLGLLDDSDCDDLTGLLNRRTFDDVIRRASAGRPPDEDDGRRPFLAVVDIDHFKRVNDEFGHPSGDDVIVHLARLMTERFDDTHFLYRFGGEEFAIVAPRMTEADARAALERLRVTIENYRFPQVRRLTVSVGFTTIAPGDAGADAFGRADQALYYSKRNGRNQVTSYDDLVARGDLNAQACAWDRLEDY